MIKSDLKKRNWTFVLYNDSCSKDWEEYLISTGVPFAYAYHDKDLTEIGEKKKEHYLQKKYIFTCCSCNDCSADDRTDLSRYSSRTEYRIQY